MNDAPVVLAVVLLASTDPITWLTPVLVVYELLAGAVVGYALGRAGAWALRRAALPSTGLYPLAALAVCVLAYSGGQLAHASGLLATYVAALVLGNSNLPHRADVLSFVEGTGWLAQIGLFVLLGLLRLPHPRLIDAVVPALIAGVVLVGGRAPAVGDRGGRAVPGAVARAGVPVVVRAARRGADRAGPRGSAGGGADWGSGLVDAVFVLVVVLTLLQGTTLPFVARRAGGGGKGRGAPRPRSTAAPLDELGCGPAAGPGGPQGSRLGAGCYLRELRLPHGATVRPGRARGGRRSPLRSDTRLRAGDQFLVVTTAAAREANRTAHPGGRPGPAGWPAGTASPATRDDGPVSAADAPGPQPAAARTRSPLLVGIAALVLVADVVTKVLAVARLEGREPIELLGGAVYLVLVRNPGAAFSLATGYTWVLSLVAVAVVVVIARIARRLRSTGWACAWPGARRGPGQPRRPDLPRARAAAGPRRGRRLALRPGRQRVAGVQPRRLLDRHRLGAARAARPDRARARRHPGRPPARGEGAAPRRAPRAGPTVGDTRGLPVPDGLDGMRVDAGLSRLLGLSRTAVATLTEDGRIAVDGRAAGKSNRRRPVVGSRSSYPSRSVRR